MGIKNNTNYVDLSLIHKILLLDGGKKTPKNQEKQVKRAIDKTVAKIVLNLIDPLDKEGSNPNFLNGEPYSQKYKNLAKIWSEFPVYKKKEELSKVLKSIHDNQVTLIISGTGSGKTVLIPKFLLKYFFSVNQGKTEEEKINHNSNIVVTNPKKLTTVYNAEYGARTLDVRLGEEVGYKFRGSPANMVSENTKLLYSTDGLLLSQILKGDTLLSMYQGVIIDEAHERKVPIDLLLYFLKNILKNRPEFKLIIMSATINPEIFKTFYDDITFGQIEVSGESNFPIESIYMEPDNKINFFNYMDVGLSKILYLLDTTETGDILMFVTSQRETEIGCNKLKILCLDRVKISEKCNSYYCAEVYSKMSDENREFAVSKNKYKEISGQTRKIIFATNVAESSITLDGIVYVIDSGLELLSSFDYLKYCQVLKKKFITQAQVKQRMGRAGRTQPGVCYHLYTEDKFNKLEIFPSPSIKLVNMNDQFLSFIRYEKILSNAIELSRKLITPLTSNQIMSSIRFLHFYNLIKIVNLKQPISSKISIETLKSIELPDDDLIYDKIEDELGVPLPYNEISYENMNTYEDWQEYQGCLTGFGKFVNSLSGYPIELVMLAFYGKLLNIDSIIFPMVGIIIAMEYKLENLINFPPQIQNNDKINFINENFSDAMPYFYSEHLFLYNLLTNYYDMGYLQFLNLPVFEKAKEISEMFSEIFSKIKKEYIQQIKEKYNLIPSELNIDDFNMIEKIYFALFLAYKYNTIKLINTRDKPKYQTIYYIENTSTQIDFQYGLQLCSDDADNYLYGICTQLTNIMDNMSMNCCTLIPNSCSNKFI